jgi:hypothetical protein
MTTRKKKRATSEIIASVKKEAKAIEEIGIVLAPLEEWQRIWVLESAIKYVQMKEEAARLARINLKGY